MIILGNVKIHCLICYPITFIRSFSILKDRNAHLVGCLLEGFGTSHTLCFLDCVSLILTASKLRARHPLPLTTLNEKPHKNSSKLKLINMKLFYVSVECIKWNEFHLYFHDDQCSSTRNNYVHVQIHTYKPNHYV